jgi:hypothetical protein
MANRPRTSRAGFTTRGKEYLDDGIKVPSVTTILDAYPKQLTKWAAETVAGYAVDHWADLNQASPSARLRELEKSVWASRDAAALRGTQIHDMAERLVAGTAVPPDEYRGPIEAYARFLDRWDVQPVIVERPVLNRTFGYAGRPDLLAEVRSVDGLALLDIKTGKNVYDSHVLQCVAYANAEIYLDEQGTELSWPREQISRCLVIHVLPDDVEVVPLDADARALRIFRHVAEVAKYMRDSSQAYKERRPWPVGRPLDWPSGPAARTAIPAQRANGGTS